MGFRKIMLLALLNNIQQSQQVDAPIEWCSGATYFPISVPTTDTRDCDALRVFANDFEFSGACSFKHSALEAMSSCAKGTTCAGLVELNTGTFGNVTHFKYLAFQDVRIWHFFFMKGRSGNHKFACEPTLPGFLDANVTRAKSRGHRRLRDSTVALAPTRLTKSGWCTAHADYVTMVPHWADSSCAVHAGAFCKWTGLQNARANCERMGISCSGIVSFGDDVWGAYSGIETYPIFYLNSASTKSLAGVYGDCQRRRLVVGAQSRSLATAVENRVERIPMLLDDCATRNSTCDTNATNVTTNRTNLTGGSVVSSSAATSSAQLLLAFFAALLLLA